MGGEQLTTEFVWKVHQMGLRVLEKNKQRTGQEYQVGGYNFISSLRRFYQ
jgi:hypothetical protein